MATWQSLESNQAVADETVRLLREAAAEAIADHGCFRLVLAGGSTPLAAYRLLAKADDDLSAWQLYYGDERCLPVDDAERNSLMVEQTGLVARCGAHFPMPAELGPQIGAETYAQTIADARPFDMVLLGMGEDGHTASLFPGHQWPDQSVIAVHGSPKPPPERVSLSVGALQDCRHMLVLVTGEGKRAALQAWRAGEDLPVGLVSDVPQASVLVTADLLEGAA